MHGYPNEIQAYLQLCLQFSLEKDCHPADKLIQFDKPALVGVKALEYSVRQLLRLVTISKEGSQ